MKYRSSNTRLKSVKRRSWGTLIAVVAATLLLVGVVSAVSMQSEPATLKAQVEGRKSEVAKENSGSPEAARLAAEDIAIPILDPLKVHHTEYRVRETGAGYERVQMMDHSESFNRDGWTTGRKRTTRLFASGRTQGFFQTARPPDSAARQTSSLGRPD